VVPKSKEGAAKPARPAAKKPRSTNRGGVIS